MEAALHIPTHPPHKASGVPWQGSLATEAHTWEPERLPWTSKPTSVSSKRGKTNLARGERREHGASAGAHILLDKQTSTRFEIRSQTRARPCPLPGNPSFPLPPAMASPATHQAALPDTWDHLNSCLLPPTPTCSANLQNSASSIPVASPASSPMVVS